MATGKHRAGKRAGRGRHAANPVRQWFSDFVGGRNAYQERHARGGRHRGGDYRDYT